MISLLPLRLFFFFSELPNKLRYINDQTKRLPYTLTIIMTNFSAMPYHRKLEKRKKKDICAYRYFKFERIIRCQSIAQLQSLIRILPFKNTIRRSTLIMTLTFSYTIFMHRTSTIIRIFFFFFTREQPLEMLD